MATWHERNAVKWHSFLAPDHPKKRQDGPKDKMRIHKLGCPRCFGVEGECTCDGELIDWPHDSPAWAHSYPNKCAAAKRRRRSEAPHE